MKIPQPSCPPWAVKALQGLSFWIGYRHSRYAGHPLGEAALVAETCNLIYGHLADRETLVCEHLYRKLVQDGSWNTDFGRHARTDLLVVKDHEAEVRPQEDLSESALIAIEVKRASAAAVLINEDLRRLAELKRIRPKIRAMLFVISEAHRPKRFVRKNGVRIKKRKPIPNANAYFRVIRACKATALFTGKETAHYACVLEVFLGPSH